MKTDKLAKQTISLRLKLLTLTESFDAASSHKNLLLTTKYKILFMLYTNETVGPAQIINALQLAKTNVAIICRELVSSGLIEKDKKSDDKRGILYHLTDKGRAEITDYLSKTSENIALAGYSDKELKLLERKLDETLEILKKR